VNTEDAKSGLGALTTRERECLRLVFAGLRAKEIAESLGVSDATVNNHLASARRKLGTSDSRLAARLLFSEERQSGIVKEWLDETTTIVAAAATALHEAVRDEGGKGGVNNSTGSDPDRHGGRADEPSLAADPGGAEDTGAGAVRHGRLSIERPDEPFADAFGEGTGARTHDRDPVGPGAELSVHTGSQTARQLTAVEKALWIMGLTIGMAFVAGAALPGMLLLIHALQSLAAGKPLLVR
jgi:DNA-binding CsgD family transcriptional regulator